MTETNQGALALQMVAEQRGVRGAARLAGVATTTFWRHMQGRSKPAYVTRMIYAQKFKVASRLFDERIAGR
jgi:hypothetical protein